jgi:hypothetical protein
MKKLYLTMMSLLWGMVSMAQLEMVNNSLLKFGSNTYLKLGKNGQSGVTSSVNFSLGDGLVIENVSGTSSGGIFIPGPTGLVLWAGSYPNTNIVQFAKNTGSSFQYVSYINNTGGYVQASDSALKTSISRVSEVLPRLQSIGAYRYRFKMPKRQAMLESDSLTVKRQVVDSMTTAMAVDSYGGVVVDTVSDPYAIGFLAQELAKVFPEVVESYNGVQYVNYSAMVPILLQAIKEQQAVINQQQKKLQEQEVRINQLSGDIVAIKRYLKLK